LLTNGCHLGAATIKGGWRQDRFAITKRIHVALVPLSARLAVCVPLSITEKSRFVDKKTYRDMQRREKQLL
jgi:hypothetical protein